MNESAVLEIRLLPWRPRPHVIDADALRDAMANGIDLSSSSDFIVPLIITILVWVFAPIIVIVIAGLLLAFELPIVVAAALALVAIRCFGLIPWTVAIRSSDGTERLERFRLIFAASRRVREVNQSLEVPVRWRIA